MADRILLLSVPHSFRLSSTRASALTVCSYIDGVTGSGATATVRMGPSCSTARLGVGVRPGKRVIMVVLVDGRDADLGSCIDAASDYQGRAMELVTCSRSGAVRQMPIQQ